MRPIQAKFHKQQNPRCAFTLIEMLVVIAILALLASIVIPSVSRALRSAKRTKCMSNQRQLAMGVYAYTLDYNGKLPTIERPGPLGVNVIWLFQVAPFVGSGGDPNITNYGAITAQFQCPEDRESLAAFADNSYLSNAWLATSYQYMLPFPLTNREGGNPITRLPSVDNPGSHPMLICAWTTGTATNYKTNAAFAGYVTRNPEGFMHGDGANVAYFDNSVRFVKNPTWTSIRGFTGE